MSAYIVFIPEREHDSAAMAEYAGKAGHSMAGHPAQPLANSGANETLEGPEAAGCVIVEFPDMDPARALFRTGVIELARTQPRLDMIDRNAAVIGGKRASHGRGRVALHHDPRRLFAVHHLPQFGEQRRSQPVKALPRSHKVQIVVWHQPGKLQDLIQHFAVLTRSANHRQETRIDAQGGDNRKQLDRLGSCPEYDQELLPARRIYHVE